MESHEHNTPPRTDPPAPSKSPAGRFVYASGSRPLAGYTIKRGVGQGGFGEIYYATSDAGKDVALKLIRRNLDVELRGIRQCLNLKHPNLLDLYDIRQDEQGDTWVVMEYVAYPSLDVVLAQRPDGLAPEEALCWIHGIGAGVAYLHDRGIVHRDLKPGNIFLDEGVVKIGDYGLSKFISCSRRSGHTESVGTVHYMAPEVANGRYGKEIDVYALGVVLYELLTGRVPFEGESIGEVLMKHLTAMPDVSMIAEPYRSVIARALEKDPENRYRSAGEMLAALPPCPGAVGPDRSFLGSSADVRNHRTEPPRNSRSGDDPVRAAIEKGISRFRRSLGRLRSVSHRRQRKPKSNGTQRIIVFMALMVLLLVGLQHGMDRSIPVLPGIAIAAGLLVWWFALRVEKSQSEGNWSESSTVVMPPPAPAEPVAVRPVATARKPVQWPRCGEKPANALVLKPPRERLAELVGSLIGCVPVAAVMSGVAALLADYWGDLQIRPEQFAWLWLVGIAGSWAVLIPSKLWEGRRGDPMLRRFVLMVIGLCVGLAAFGAGEILMVKLRPVELLDDLPRYGPPSGFFDSITGQPLPMAYAACFGTLFLLVRWWRQADPLRPARLSLWTLAMSVLAAAVVAQMWKFPQPWLPMAAGTISAAVQLAAPWVRSSKRK